MVSAIASFVYYLTAYSLGILVLSSVFHGARMPRDSSRWWFFWATLAMTVTVLVSTFQNFLRVPADSALLDILSGINYLTASFFTVVIIRFFHEAYPWRGARTVNAMSLVATGTLTVLIAYRVHGPAFLTQQLSPDLLLIAKNSAIAYTTILTFACRD